ncbi:hypothetical protein EDD37DRAFT_331650 [Exophiala viscosa]|uniref:Uncharacterized protein n=1 Tax=Exophiala viscosa TaxID=2486360 RepID=A0AAN6ICQ2_9EURO|nr:hypothetical protein EDD36DRAFT_254005 [Exophiala viscosa]KAI1626127.1 hypothetical protein EDD37DRAFT_331650 [Exophiala viscosa]
MLIVCVFLFLYGLLGQVVSAVTLMSLGLGAVKPNVFLVGWCMPSFGSWALLANVFVANSPQVLLSTIYFTYNSLFTCYLLAVEWNSFAHQRKGIRVSSDTVGQQRASYFLQLPLRWGIPLMTLSVILHWLCPQSLFLVSIGFDHLVTQQLDTSGSVICNVIDDISGPSTVGGSTTECFNTFITCSYPRLRSSS